MIEIPKIFRIYQWIRENFSVGDNGMNPLVGILPIPQKIWPKGTEDIYF